MRIKEAGQELQCSVGKSPPLVVIVRQEAVDEAQTSDDGGKEQHLGVETQPGKINPDLLPVVLPVERKQGGGCKPE